ncbi:MaoC family dehydratase [Haloglomus halophilum]|uniref:MaoC family dehydratase n=1 Tax=Haloglomus halophilum TaxID=2962672 RepID=UPI0020C95E85|nr:MaoC family dehydratase [Haloglomus halophilum]
MSSGSGYPSVFDYWSRTSTAMVEGMIEANRAAATAFTMSADSRSDADSEAERGRRAEERITAGGDLPEWETDIETAGTSRTLSVGDRVRFSKRLSEADVERFAAASGDTNPLHLDEEWAQETRFEGRIAHGTLVAGTISAALARLPGGVIYLSQDLEFRAPVRIGDSVTADVEVVEDLGKDRFRLRTTVESEGRTVIDGEAVVLIEDVPDHD